MRLSGEMKECLMETLKVAMMVRVILRDYPMGAALHMLHSKEWRDRKLDISWSTLLLRSFIIRCFTFVFFTDRLYL